MTSPLRNFIFVYALLAAPLTAACGDLLQKIAHYESEKVKCEESIARWRGRRNNLQNHLKKLRTLERTLSLKVNTEDNFDSCLLDQTPKIREDHLTAVLKTSNAERDLENASSALFEFSQKLQSLSDVLSGLNYELKRLSEINNTSSPNSEPDKDSNFVPSGITSSEGTPEKPSSPLERPLFNQLKQIRGFSITCAGLPRTPSWPPAALSSNATTPVITLTRHVPE